MPNNWFYKLQKNHNKPIGSYREEAPDKWEEQLGHTKKVIRCVQPQSVCCVKIKKESDCLRKFGLKNIADRVRILEFCLPVSPDGIQWTVFTEYLVGIRPILHHQEKNL